MESAPLDFLKELLATPSPSGYEQKIQKVVRSYVESFADEVATDVHGNVVACVNPGADIRVMYAGHCDQIGLLVSHIDENGFVYGQTIGGWDPQQLVGQRLTIWAKDGPVAAVISRKPIHLQTPDERKQVAQFQDLWLDIGVTSRSEAEALLRIGDPITLNLGFQEMAGGRANAPGMDDKTGVWVVMEALRRAAAGKLNVSLYAVSTVQEEIGLRGARTSAFAIDPHVGIAVDVTHATDGPNMDQRERGACCLGRGPAIVRGPNINPIVEQQLLDAAGAGDIPYQSIANGRGVPNDANALQINRSGVAAGLVGLPNRYMHSAVEVVQLSDIDHAADLLAGFATRLNGDEDFTPV